MNIFEDLDRQVETERQIIYIEHLICLLNKRMKVLEINTDGA